MAFPRALDLELSYNLAADKMGLSVLAEDVTRHLEENGQFLNGQPIFKLLEPIWLDSSTYNATMILAKKMRVAIDRIEFAARNSRDIMQALLGHGRLFELAYNTPFHKPEFVGRLDGFLGDDGILRFVEYNPGSCGGMAYADSCQALFDGMPIIQEMRQRLNFDGVNLSKRYISSFIAAARARGHSTSRQMSIILPNQNGSEALIDTPEMRALAHAYTAMGGTIRFVNPADLDYDGTHLCIQGTGLDAAFFVDWTNLVATLPVDHPLWRGAEGSETWVVNPLSSFLLRGSKSVFALMSDPEFHYLFDQEITELLIQHIPWTRIVANPKRDENEQRCFEEFITQNQDDLVLKPIFSIAGRGVYLGWEVSETEWQIAIVAAKAADYVVQRRVPIPSRKMRCIENGKAVETSRMQDLCPFLWDEGVAEGLFARVSDSSLLNVSAGAGSFAAVYVVRNDT